MVWYDYAVIKLATVFGCSTAIGLTRKAYIFLLLCINTGTFNASISSPSTTTPGYSLTFANKGFSGADKWLVLLLSIMQQKHQALVSDASNPLDAACRMTHGA